MTRSELMSRIRSRGNASTELALTAMLRRGGVTGWRRHAKVLGIRPDFVFRKMKIAVFTDGCFWHACPLHCKRERLTSYWSDKLFRNHVRDIDQTLTLKAYGWRVVRIWEHDLNGNKPHKCGSDDPSICAMLREREVKDHVILPIIRGAVQRRRT